MNVANCNVERFSSTDSICQVAANGLHVSVAAVDNAIAANHSITEVARSKRVISVKTANNTITPLIKVICQLQCSACFEVDVNTRPPVNDATVVRNFIGYTIRCQIEGSASRNSQCTPTSIVESINCFLDVWPTVDRDSWCYKITRRVTMEIPQAYTLIKNIAYLSFC
ncbi:hypothetical protein ENROMM110B_21170 [Enterobacter rongchengensis]